MFSSSEADLSFDEIFEREINFLEMQNSFQENVVLFANSFSKSTPNDSSITPPSSMESKDDQQNTSSGDESFLELFGISDQTESIDPQYSSNDEMSSSFEISTPKDLFMDYGLVFPQLPNNFEDASSLNVASAESEENNNLSVDVVKTHRTDYSAPTQVEIQRRPCSAPKYAKSTKSSSRDRRGGSEKQLGAVRAVVGDQENTIVNIARAYHQQHPIPGIVPGSSKSIELYSKSNPKKFRDVCLGSFPSHLLESFFCDYDFLYQESQYGIRPEDYYGMIVALEFSLKCKKLFSNLGYTETIGIGGKTISEERNTFFAKHRYFKGTRKCGELYVYDNTSREKLSDILGLCQTVVASIELIVEEIANRLDILINGDRVSRAITQLIHLGGGKPTKETWNKRPIEVQKRLYAVVKRALWDTFEFRGKVVELFVKRVAYTVAQNNFKRLNKNRGARKDALNINYRKNLMKGKVSKSSVGLVF
ncbi:hypothetical protein DASC09_004290 [Saccharomycopsis crataegensis]|uniref:Uncharacterized protein n=1 Tax=Saccharomycopsis crataegensis TaxID=43959 RepID=A0AAV5QFJ2_9ASCO|nr:hypothetical protein DASC09_004290 [Saccharomycopsis crataegensis]